MIRKEIDANQEFRGLFEITTCVGSLVGNLDICGMCFSKGHTPIEINYEVEDKCHPLAVSPSLGTNWLVKYKRYVFGTEEEAYSDWVGGATIPYPVCPNETELVSIKCINGTIKYRVSTKSQKGEWLNPTSTSGSTKTLGGKTISILLGGREESGNFIATPGVYRDLLVFPNIDTSDYSNDDIIGIADTIDNSLLSVTFTGLEDDTPYHLNPAYYIRSSLFEETL